MILINVQTEKFNQNFTCKSNREAQKFLNDLAEKHREHPWELARKKHAKLVQIEDTWLRNHKSWRTRNSVKGAVIQASMTEEIIKAKEAWAMIDPPGKVVVNITKIKD